MRIWLRLGTGLLTVVIATSIAAILLAEQRWGIGGAIAAAAAFRLFFWVRELSWTLRPEEDEDEGA